MTSVAGKLAHLNKQSEGVGSIENPINFCNQDYSALKAQCLQNGCLFEDSAFPAGSRSLGFNELGPLSPKTRGVVWKRPKELCSKPYFIDNGATRTDICQGELGDCWLLAAIASLTLDEQILARVVPPGQGFEEDYAGIFHFQFWQFGDWVDVVIDDKLPTRDGHLLFVHSSEGSEFWSALLEKAYAKLNGCYEALAGGCTIEGFEDFTGGVAERYELNEANPNLFKIIKKALRLGSLLGCSIDITSAYDVEAVTSLKLVKGHAYSLTGAEEVPYQGSKVELVRLRNPWGEVEWTGPWSDASSEWSQINPEDKAKLVKVVEDGEFWMAFPDFIKQFSTLEICNLTPDTLTSNEVGQWNNYQFSGQWRMGSTAGGCLNYPATFCSNPQYAIKLEDVDDNPLDEENGCTLLVGLIQKYMRKDKRFGNELNTIGLVIYQVPPEYKGRTDVHLGPDILLRHKPVAMSSPFINTREICNRFHLPPGEYVIIPSTFQPHKRGSFLLRVFTEKEVDASQRAANLRVKISEQNISNADIDPQFKDLFKQVAGNESEVSVFQLVQALNKVLSKRSDIKTEGLSLETCRYIVCLLGVSFAGWKQTFGSCLLGKDGNPKLGLVEFHGLWLKIQKYVKIFKSFDSDHSGTMSTHEMRGALAQAGFQVNNALLQVIVSRYAGPDFSIPFDNFVGCLIRLEMLYRMFNTLDGNKSGKIELDMLQWFCLAMH